jgi:SAM-dependent methyltransferase
LDVGCGTGRHLLPLAEAGLHVFGVDRDGEFVAAARDKLKSKRLTANGGLMIADARFLPIKPAVFDVIICMGNVLGDVGINKKLRIAITNEMMRIAKSEAVFLVEFVNRYWEPKDVFVWLFRYLATSMKKFSGRKVEFGDYTETLEYDQRKIRLTFHAFTTREAIRLFSSQGLDAKVEKRGRFFHDWFIVTARR